MTAHRMVGLCPSSVSRAGGAHTHADPKEIAQNFKEQGNEYFKGKRYREALGFYTQGVGAKPDDAQLREALLLNRAACNLELRASLLSFPPP
jgi:hypothetical protein